MRVVLAGGGTAGHIEPALALADALRQGGPSAMIICLGTERGLETRLVPMRGYELALIPAVPLPRAVTPRLLAVPGKLAGAVSAAAGVLDRMKADVLVGFGGYVATPGYLAARRRHVPIVVHEANPRPGLANKLGARLTENVFTGHPATQLAHATYLGIPIRREIAELDRLGVGDKGRAPLRPAPGPAGTAGHRRIAGSPVAQRGGVGRAGLAALVRGAGAARHRPEQRGRGPAVGRRALRVAAVRGPDGAGLRGRRLRAVPGRRHDLPRADRGRPARRLRPATARQRGTTAERRADRGRRRRSDGRGRGAGPGLDPRQPAASAARHRPGGEHVRGRGRAGPQGRRPRAGRGDHRRGSPVPGAGRAGWLPAGRGR